MGEYTEKQQKNGSERKQFLQKQVKQSKRRNAVPKLIARTMPQKAERNSYSNHIQIKDAMSTPIQCCPKKAGETKATAIGKKKHKERADERRRSGEFDLVNEKFRRRDGTPVMVPKTVNRRTGIASAKMQYVMPDAVKGPDKGGEIRDDKPLGRPVEKDFQELGRNVAAYTQVYGVLPKKIIVDPYNPETGSDHEAIEYPASDFIRPGGM